MGEAFGGLTHTQTSKIHFGKRLKDRYGIECTEKIIQSVITQIRTHRSIRIERISLTKMVHGVKIDGRDVIVMYSTTRGIPITALPSSCDSWKNAEKRQKWSMRKKDWRKGDEEEEEYNRPRRGGKSCRTTRDRFKYLEN